jgi:hypothetical protein
MVRGCNLRKHQQDSACRDGLTFAAIGLLYRARQADQAALTTRHPFLTVPMPSLHTAAVMEQP